MSSILDRPLRALLEPGQAGKLGPEGEAVVARLAQMAANIALTMGKSELLTALSASTPAGFLGVLAERLACAQPPNQSALEALRGKVALAESIVSSGGLWRADEAQRELRVSRATLQAWRDGRRVLALPMGDGSFGYPVVQFTRPSSDVEAPKPHPAMAKVLEAAADRLDAPELFVVLAAPQPALAKPGGDARTGFEAMHDGDAESVVGLIRHLVTPEDEGAPPIEEEETRPLVRAW